MLLIKNLRLPVLSSDGIAGAVSVSPIHELGPLVVSHVVSSNVDVSVLPENVVLDPVYLESSLSLA